jgi:hypothetical protein
MENSDSNMKTQPDLSNSTSMQVPTEMRAGVEEVKVPTEITAGIEERGSQFFTSSIKNHEQPANFKIWRRLRLDFKMNQLPNQCEMMK